MPSAVDDEDPDDKKNNANPIDDTTGAKPLSKSEADAFNEMINRSELAELRNIVIEDLVEGKTPEDRVAEFLEFSEKLDECIANVDKMFGQKIPKWANGWNARVSKLMPGQSISIDKESYKLIYDGIFLLTDYHAVLSKFKDIVSPYIHNLDWETVEDFLFEQSSSKSLEAPDDFKNLMAHPRAGSIFVARMNMFKAKFIQLDGVIENIATALQPTGVGQVSTTIGDESIQGFSLEGVKSTKDFEDWGWNASDP